MKDPRDFWALPTFVDALSLSVGAAFFCAGLLFASYRGPNDGLPPNDKLVTLSGRITYVRLFDNRNQGRYTIFRLGNSPTLYSFGVGMGDFLAVQHALCDGCEASVWIDPNDRRPEFLAWQISVNGEMIASYPEVKAHWTSETQNIRWVGSLAGVASLGLGVLAFLRRRQDSRRAQEMNDD